ncbi:YjdF family protein [Eubacteriales bacterium OttesenSCG-928-K08]|nr:YjdF family protein [Eubacteriales bacterium OttesenSCG-928-K08]
MLKTEIKLTVFFEDPFWVGVYERISGGKLEACKITFGSEPKDYEVYDFLLQNWGNLRFSPPIKSTCVQDKKVNPKRMQRAVAKQLATQGVGTKAQQALKLQQEENKIMRKQKNHQQKEDEKQRQFELRQQKKKEKHRGR